jgi:hypothetical protein
MMLVGAIRFDGSNSFLQMPSRILTQRQNAKTRGRNFNAKAQRGKGAKKRRREDAKTLDISHAH